MFFLKFVRSCLGNYLSATILVILLTGTAIAEESRAPIVETPFVEIAGTANRSQITPVAQPDRITGEYVKGYFSDTGKILTSPPSWDGADWLKAGLVIGATSGLYFADADIRDFAQKHQGAVGDKAAIVGNALGNPLYTLPPLGIFYLYGYLYEDPKARRASLLATESLVISGAFTWTLKLAAQRPRPFTGEGPDTWNGPRLKAGDYSFPSGHATAAFSIASVFAEEYGNNPYVPPIAYGLATLTGLSRIYDNKHWASDVFFGAAIGYFVGKSVVKYHAVQSSPSLKILPIISQQRIGLMAEYHF
jgi:membrane-associated phospholipid phosphatase